jgi:hypothetical protein
LEIVVNRQKELEQLVVDQCSKLKEATTRLTHGAAQKKLIPPVKVAQMNGLNEKGTYDKIMNKGLKK